jgi:adenylate cyclase
MQEITPLGWWQSGLACLVDKSGCYLAHAEAWMKGRNQLGETHDPLEMKVLEDIQEKAFGTALGSGHPPGLVRLPLPGDCGVGHGKMLFICP